MDTFATVFLALIFETTPFLLAGVLVSVLAGPVVERVLGSAAFRTPGLAMATGAGAGMVLPMCDCGSRPLAHRLMLAGQRQFAGAFLVAAPVVNPIVIVTTWLAFRDGGFVALRLGVTFVAAMAVAVVLSAMAGQAARPVEALRDGGGHSLREAPQRVMGEFLELFQFVVIGCALAAFVQVFLDRDALLPGDSVWIAIAGMMALAFLLSLCSSVDAFVAASLGAGLGTGPLLAFLTLGPILNLKSVPLYGKLFTTRAVVFLAIVTVEVVFVGAMLAEYRGW